MSRTSAKHKIRRQQVRARRAQATGSRWSRLLARDRLWWGLAVLGFMIAASAIALSGEATIRYSVGQRIDRPILAEVEFQVPDEARTREDKEAARAATPSYYRWNASSLTFDRVRSDLMRYYEAGVGAETFEAFQEAVAALGWPADEAAYTRLRGMGDDEGRTRFQRWVDGLKLEHEYVFRDQVSEARTPPSSVNHILLEAMTSDGAASSKEVPYADLVSINSRTALEGRAAQIAKGFPFEAREFRPVVETVVLATFSAQPTIVYDQERTVAEMTRAESSTREAKVTYEKGKPFISASDGRRLSGKQYDLLVAHRAAYNRFLASDDPDAVGLRRQQWLQRAGVVALVVCLSIALFSYTATHQDRVFTIRARTIAFAGLMLGAVAASRALDFKWPQIPELILAPCLLAGIVLAIVYPQRFALGAMSIVAVLVVITVRGDVALLLTLLAGLAVAIHQLDEIRSRTKLITVGCLTAMAVALTSTAGALVARESLQYALQRHALWAASMAMLSAFVVSGVLPFIEQLFRVATSLTLLEWRDPTKPLLQLLAREAPGTNNHSLVLGTLADAACERIGANGLLAQVGALYHDIGKIHKADYFVENQEGRINRHANLSPTMSLLIILGHVKDGVEMAKEYKLPRALHQFIEEHHGTTVVRYFHHVAAEKQPQIASGKHDREVPEAEFRYAGPKPRSRESAVLMLCDGVEGAVRALQEPTVGRIEGVVHKIVTDRLNDGQFDDCDITLKQIRLVEESLVKSLCSIYHGRVAYPKAQRAAEQPAVQEKMSI
ncbi:MAG: HD family phosphohydrolase [Phycisphaerae bacterium]